MRFARGPGRLLEALVLGSRPRRVGDGVVDLDPAGPRAARRGDADSGALLPLLRARRPAGRGAGAARRGRPEGAPVAALQRGLARHAGAPAPPPEVAPRGKAGGGLPGG